MDMVLSALKEVQLDTKSGILVCRQTEGKIHIDFPQFDFRTVVIPAYQHAVVLHHL